MTDFKRLFAFLVIFYFFLNPVIAKSLCQPDLNLPKYPDEVTETTSEKDPVFVYFDGSLSMQGYTKDQPGQKNLYRDVIDDLQQISENVGNKTFYHKFGSKVEPIKENEIAKATKPGFYICKDSQAKCNNQETRLELPFKAAKANKDATYVIVTDLFLSSKQLVGSTLGSLTKPLKSILKDGKSIGIVGVMSSFNGNIYDIPKKDGGTFKYSEAKKRPFYIIIIGDQKNINQIKKNLEEQHFIDAEDQYKFALITSSPVLHNLNKEKIITEDSIARISNSENFNFEYTDNNLPVYKFDTDNKKKMKFKISMKEIIVPGSVGIGEFSLKENLWSSKETNCKKIDDWRKTKHKDISKLKTSDTELTIDMFKGVSLKKLFRGMRHFYTVSIFADKPGNLSEEKFKEWSIRDSDAEDFTDQSPIEFKTLNLTKIIKILNSVANDTFEPTLIGNIALNINLLK
tara:strand:+ start:1731 stop:3104 length:1374 start_codon:yes stop_codon:yes gene_type:complete